MEIPQEFEYFDTTNVNGETFSTSAPTEEATSWLDYADFTYEGYIPQTIDPDWSFTIYIIVGCLCVNLSLPLWVYLGKRFGFHESSGSRRRRREAEWGNTFNKATSNNNDNNSRSNNNNASGDEVLLKRIDDARSVVSGYSYTPGGSLAGDEDYSFSPRSVLSGSVAMSRAGTHLGFHHRPQNMRGGDAASVFSGTSGFTDAILAARPKRMPHARRHANKTKRIVQSRSCVNGDDQSVSNHTRENGGKRRIDVRMAAEFKRAEMDILLQRNLASTDKSSYGEITPNTTNSDVDLGGVVLDDNKSEIAHSILSKLDADAISVRDAVDARDGVTLPLEDDRKTTKNSPFDGYLSAVWKRIMNTVDIDKEMKKYLSLAGHYSAQGVLEEVLGVVEIALIGRFMGIRQASAYIVVEIITGFTGTISTGFYECTGVLIPHAYGARNYLLAGRYMQLGAFFYLLTALPGAVFWAFYTDKAVLWYKFDEETAKMAQLYFYATMPGYFTYGADAVLYELLNTVGREKYCTYFTVISSCIHTGIVACMLVGGVTDLFVLGLFETASDIIFLVINFGILVHKGWLDPYWEGLFKTNGLRDWGAIKNVVNTALPLSFAWILTYGEWEIMTLFCRHMGSNGAEVAAWGLTGYLWSAFETLTDGFGDAAEVRVGFRMGAGQTRLAKLCTDKALYVSFTTAVYATGVMFLFAMYIPGWLTPDPTLQKMIFDILPLIGFGQILMVWGMVAWAILGAQGRIRIATALEFFMSWGIGAPIAAILVYVFNYNIEGIVGGLTIGYTIGTNVYLYMLHTSDWEQLSAAVVAQSAAEGQAYNEFDWDDLPDYIQDAATVLGYNKWIWESNDTQPESDSKDWDELTHAERRAADILGYNRQSWDGESEPNSNSSDDTGASSNGSEDWANLSKEAKNAAKILGYTQSIWDNDGSPPTEDKDWDELSPVEKSAAKTLGYSKKKWDGDDDDDESDISSYKTPKSSGSAGSGSVLEQIISDPSNVLGSLRNACSFDSSNDGAESSGNAISNGISSMLGLSNNGDRPKESSSF